MRVATLLLLLAGCAEGPAPDAGAGVAVAACAEAVAAHVGKDTSAVTATWSGVGPDGLGMVTVTDAAGAGAERLHTCTVDGSGRVREIRHPGA
jgi:hypothetical protein